MTKSPRKMSLKTSVVSNQQPNINLNDAYSELIRAYFDLQRTNAKQNAKDHYLTEEETTDDQGLQETTSD